MELAEEGAVGRVGDGLLERPERAEEGLLESLIARELARGLRAEAREARGVREDRARGGDDGRFHGAGASVGAASVAAGVSRSSKTVGRSTAVPSASSARSSSCRRNCLSSSGASSGSPVGYG